MKPVRLVALMLMWPIGAHAATTVSERADAKAATIVADVRQDNPRGGRDEGVWDYAAIDSATRRLLVARMTGVQTVLLAHETFGPMLAVGRRVHAVLPLSATRVLYTNGDSGTVSVVDGRSGVPVATVPAGHKPDGAIYDAALGEAFVMNGGDGTVTRIDVRGTTPRLGGSIAIGGKLEAPALGSDNRLFVNIEDHDALAIVSLDGVGRLLREVPLPGCQAPTGLAYDKASRLLVSTCDNGVAMVLDEAGRVRAALPIGPHPDAAIGDPAHRRVFVPSGGDGTVSEISLDGTPRVRRVWRSRAGARTGAYDPATQRLYLPYGTVVRERGQPPRLVPGSFGILVLDVR